MRRRLLSAGFKYGFKTDYFFSALQRSKKAAGLYCHSQGFYSNKAFGNELMLWSFLVASGRRSSQGHVDVSHNLTSRLPFSILPPLTLCLRQLLATLDVSFLPTLSSRCPFFPPLYVSV